MSGRSPHESVKNSDIKVKEIQEAQSVFEPINDGASHSNLSFFGKVSLD